MKLNSYGKWKSSLTSLADDLSAAGEGLKAASLLQNLLAVNPGEADAGKRYFDALLAAKDFEGARRQGLLLSMICLSENQPDAAIQILNRLIPHFPDDLNLKLKAAKLLISTGAADRAEALYVQAARQYLSNHIPLGAIQMYTMLGELNPKSYDYREQIARIYRQEGILDKAIAEYFRLAEMLTDEKRFDEGAAMLREILVIDPTHGRASLQLAEIYLKLKRAGDATDLMNRQIENRISKEKLDEAVDMSKRFIEMLAKKKLHEEANLQRENLAGVLLDNGRENEAVKLFNQVSEAALDAGNFEKYLTLLERQQNVYERTGNRDENFALYKKMILTLAPRDLDRTHNALDRFVESYADKNLKELDAALRGISKSLKENGSTDASDEVAARLGDVYAVQHKTDEAVRIYQKIPAASLRLAELLAEEGEIDKAMPFYVKSIERAASNQDMSGCLEIFDKAKRRDPKNAPLYALMGGICFRRQDWDSALQYYEQSLKRDPNLPEAVVGTAMTYAKKGMLKEIARLAEGLSNKTLIDEIVSEYRKALSEAASPEKAAMSLGLLYDDLGRHADAAKEFEKAVSDSEIFVRAAAHLALCYKRLGQNEAAVREFSKVLDRTDLSEEESLDIRYNLAVTYEAIGKREEALNLYQDILVTDIGYQDVNQRIRNLTSTGKGKKVISLPGKDKNT